LLGLVTVVLALDLLAFQGRFDNIAAPAFHRDPFYGRDFFYNNPASGIRPRLDLANFRVSALNKAMLNANKSVIFSWPSYIGTLGYLSQRFSKFISNFGFPKGAILIYPEDEALTNDRFLDLCAVRYVFQSPSEFAERPSALSRLNLFYDFEVAASDDAALARLVDPAFVPAQKLVLAPHTDWGIAPVAGRMSERIRITLNSNDEVRARVRTLSAGIILFVESYDPGWVVTIDGQRVAAKIGNYNFILPYSYPATHAILFALAALYFLFRFFDRSISRDVHCAGVCLFLSMISKPEIGLMLGLSFLAVVALMKCAGAKVRFLWPLVLFPVAGSLFIYGIFFVVAGPRIWESNLFDLLKSNTQASDFVGLLSGAQALIENLSVMLESAFFYLLFVVWFGLAGYGAMQAERLRRAVQWRLAVTAITLMALAGAVVVLKTVYFFGWQYRSIPFIYLIVGALSSAAYLRQGRKAGDLKLFVLSLFSFLVVVRIIFFIYPSSYGFYLLVPGFIIYHVFFFRILPQLVRNKLVAAAFYVGFTLVLFLLMADYFQCSRSFYQHRTLRVPSPRGELFVSADPRGAGARALVEFLLNQTPKDATVAIFPEGLMINFLAGRENPLYYYSFLPQDMVRESVEQAMIDDMVLKKPDYVIVLQRPVEEYGSRGFGVDYAKKLIGHIDKNYTPLAQYGPLPFAPDNFSAVIFKLNQ